METPPIKLAENVSRIMKKKEWEVLRLPDKKMEHLLFTYPDKFNITLEEFDECECYWKNVVLPYCEKILTPKYINEILHIFFKNKLGFIQQKRKEFYKLNDDLRESGVAFEDRTERVFSKLDGLEQMWEETNKFLSSFEILPLNQWLIPADVRSIKQGVNNFIIQNYPRFICQKN